MHPESSMFCRFYTTIYYFWSWYLNVYVDWRGVNYPGAEGAGYEGGWCGIGVWGRGCQLEAHKWMSLVRTLSELESHEIYLGETWHLWIYCPVLYYSKPLAFQTILPVFRCSCLCKISFTRVLHGLNAYVVEISQPWSEENPLHNFGVIRTKPGIPTSTTMWSFVLY